ncbi:MAG: thiol peroxidase [Chloroflexi bacterium]|nr:thiol peroxidase [Chloroflexota bacterium]
MTEERPNGVTLGGTPHTVRGPILAVGENAPDAELVATDWSRIKLSDYEGKVRLLSVVPSLDTGVCNAQTQRFNEEAAAFNEDVVVLTISADLPPAQGRWVNTNGAERVKVVSCHYDMAFADSYGVHDTDYRWCQRAVFVIDQDGTLQHAEYVPEIGDEVNFDAAVAKVKELAG